MCCDGCLCFSPTERTRGFLQGLQDPSPPVQASPGGGHRFLHNHRGWDSVARVRFIAHHMIAEALIVRLQVRQGYAYTELDTWEAQGAGALLDILCQRLAYPMPTEGAQHRQTPQIHVLVFLMVEDTANGLVIDQGQRGPARVQG